MHLYTLICKVTGESQNVVVCDKHAHEMPDVDSETVRACFADDDIACEFCEAEKIRTRKVWRQHVASL